MENKSLSLFGRFITQKSQRREIIGLTLIMTVLGILIHLFYPYPFTTADSGAYFLGASQGIFNIYRPMGYSGYLRFIHHLNPGISFIFWFTYYLNFLASLLLLYTVKYLLEIKDKLFFYPLCFLALFSPCALFATNFIMSDSLFCSLTILFITLAIWLLYEKKWYVLILLLASFLALYKVRYTGMFYIVVLLYVSYIAFTKTNNTKRIITFLLPILCFLFLYTQTKREYYKETGFNTSSGFSGWQLINNASVLLPEAKSLPLSAFKNSDTKTLHLFLQSIPDSIYRDSYTFNTLYMWDRNLPYKQFLLYYMQQTKQSYPVGWIYISLIYSDYAKTLIYNYPGTYLTKFIFPSFISTFKFNKFTEFSPFANEPMLQSYYNLNFEKYEHNTAPFAAINTLRHILHYFYWIILIISTLWFIANIRKNKFNHPQWRIAFILFIFMVSYIGASVLASPNTSWRYAMPIYLPSLIFILYSIQDLCLKCKIKNKL